MVIRYVAKLLSDCQVNLFIYNLNSDFVEEPVCRPALNINRVYSSSSISFPWFLCYNANNVIIAGIRKDECENRVS